MLILLARGRDLADFDKSKSSRFTHRRLLKRAAAELLCIDGTEHARGSAVRGLHAWVRDGPVRGDTVRSNS